MGYHPHVIHSGRRVNDSMGVHVANRVARSIMRRARDGRPLVTVQGVQGECAGHSQYACHRHRARA
jgi:UDP-N-acetyl-D-galactosamine dehydrogenase